MSKQSFDHLLGLVAPSITKQDTRLRDFIEPRLEKLAVTLHHLAEGASHKSIAAHYRLGRSTVSEIRKKDFNCTSLVDEKRCLQASH